MPRASFSLQQIRSFVAVADSEHVSKAAASLFLTQGAVTQQLRHFERGLGLQLLERDGRRVRLTGAGRELAVACRATLRSVEVLEETARSMRTLSSGSLHVGASPTCAGFYLPARLAEFARRNPGVKLEVKVEPTSDLNKLVVAGALDCALIEGEADDALDVAVLAEDELILVAHRDHPLSALRQVTSADLGEHRYLRRGPAFSAESRIKSMLGEVYERLETLNLGHPEYVHAAAVAGLGFAALPRLAVQSDIAAGVLRALATPPIIRSILAIRRRSVGGPTLEAFWRFLKSGEISASKTIGGVGEDGI